MSSFKLLNLTPSEDHEIFIGKMISIPIMFVLVLGACLLPYALSKLKKAKTIISFATCLSAGAMLAIGLLHTFPESREVFDNYFEGAGHDDHDHDHTDPGTGRENLPFTGSVLSSALNSGSDVKVDTSELQQLYSLSPNHVFTPEQLVLHQAFVQHMKQLVELNNQPNPKSDLKSLSIPSFPSLSQLTSTSTDVDTNTNTFHTLADAHGHSHPYPYTELCAGLAILSLYVIEHLVSAFLEWRGNNVAHCHGHSHGYHGDDEGDHEMTDMENNEHHHHHHHEHECTEDQHQHQHPPRSLRDLHDDHAHTCTNEDHDHENDEADLDNNSPDVSQDEDGVDPNTIAVTGVIDVLGTPNPDLQPTSSSISIDIHNANTNDSATSEYALNGSVPKTPRSNDLDLDDDHAILDPAQQKSRSERKRNIDAFISAAAICIHCIFNGMALGAERSAPSQFWTLFIASVGHKVIDGLAVGVPIYRANLPFRLVLGIFILVAAASPIGVAIGYAVSSENSDSLAQAVIMALSGGSFIFVAVFEMMPAGFANKSWLLLKVLFVFVGFGVVAVVAKWA